MKVTLKHIADDTGYSISTISRVLNGSDRISSDTKDEVLKSAKLLGYKFSVSNGIHYPKKHLNIVLAASGFHEGEFYSCFFHGLNSASKNNNIHLFLKGIIDIEKELKNTISDLSSGAYDGMILFIPEINWSDYMEIAKLAPKKMAIVSNSLIENPIFPTITFDSYSGGYLAAEHFHKLGYKTVGVITGPKERSESRFRKNGFVDYVSQQPDMEVVWVFDGDYTFESGIQALEEFKTLKNKPRAVFSTNDSMAMSFSEYARRNLIKIPEDVALIGYDDLPFNEHISPTLTSIHTDFQKLGASTIKLLLEQIENVNKEPAMLSFVPVSISVRESCGALKK